MKILDFGGGLLAQRKWTINKFGFGGGLLGQRRMMPKDVCPVSKESCRHMNWFSCTIIEECRLEEW
jgi:hypothetical protein